MPATNTERTVLEALRQSRDEICAEIREEEERLRELEARRYDMEEQIARLQGDPLRAEWCQAEAESKRRPSAEASQMVHARFVRMMAAMHLRYGTVPSPGPLAQTIEEEMDAMRAEVRQ